MEKQYPELLYLSLMLNTLDDAFEKDKNGEPKYMALISKKDKQIFNDIKNITNVTNVFKDKQWNKLGDDILNYHHNYNKYNKGR